MLKKVIIRKKLFGGNVFQLPDEFLKSCAENTEKEKIMYVDEEQHRIVLYADGYSPSTTLKFVSDGEANYGDVEGFFLFDSDIFYKPQGRAGKRVSDQLLLKDVFSQKSGKKISNPREISGLRVTKLRVIV